MRERERKGRLAVRAEMSISISSCTVSVEWRSIKGLGYPVYSQTQSKACPFQTQPVLYGKSLASPLTHF